MEVKPCIYAFYIYIYMYSPLSPSRRWPPQRDSNFRPEPKMSGTDNVQEQVSAPKNMNRVHFRRGFPVRVESLSICRILRYITGRAGLCPGAKHPLSRD
jgi:hypothetical protein